MVLDVLPTQRTRKLSTRLVSDPVVPILGWTKTIELAVIGSRDVLAFAAFAVTVTLAWVYADHIKRTAEDVAEEVSE